MPPLRKHLIAGWSLAAGVVLVLAAACAAAAPPRATSLALQTVDQFQTNGGVYPGYRRNHAKGVCISGYFQSNGHLARYSVAQVFAPGRRTPMVGRLSIPGTNPYAWGDSTPIRGMALQLTQANGEQWRTAMNAVPAFPVATPEANLEFLKAQQPDPATGNPEPGKLAAFFTSHPRADAFRKWDRTTKPSASFVGPHYNSLDAFELVDAAGKERAVRWSMVPEGGGGDARVPNDDPDFLFEDLRRRLSEGPLRWRLLITLAGPGDAVEDASIPWPKDRRKVDAGTLVVLTSQPQPTGACRDINFNPLVLPRGIEPSKDPLLEARAATYAESHRRRVSEEQRLAAPASGTSAS